MVAMGRMLICHMATGTCAPLLPASCLPVCPPCQNLTHSQMRPAPPPPVPPASLAAHELAAAAPPAAARI